MARNCRRSSISYAGSCVSGSIFGERPARFENHVRINKDVKRRLGHPGAAHRSEGWRTNELNMAKDAADTIEEIFHAAGWEIVCEDRPVLSRRATAFTKWARAAWATIPRPACSIKWNQSHDIKNLFVVDGAAFVTCGWQNPTMTISGALHARLANIWRSRCARVRYESIGRDANRRFSELLRTVQKGRSVVVTSHGKPVAKITPSSRTSGPRRRPLRAVRPAPNRTSHECRPLDA